MVLNSCAYVEPYVQEVNFVSVAQERSLGEQLETQIATEMALVKDPDVLGRVERIGKRLVQGLSRRDFDYRFHVLEDKTPNAFTIPGGVIYVHTGLLRFVSDDDELAGVLGHELGHAYERHPAKAITRMYGIEYLTNLLFKGTQGQVKTLALTLAKGGILSRYSRVDEYRADEVGYILARKAGYDTSGLLRFLRKIQNLERGGVSIPFLNSHPPTPDRIARLESLGRTQPVVL
ncbi:MAG: M48 family metalloprotease [Candidatus Omnitrophica bacterium]|nr:M48 family metalloprotease [Candidatus Omnitrophota bacterium]